VGAGGGAGWDNGGRWRQCHGELKLAGANGGGKGGNRACACEGGALPFYRLPTMRRVLLGLENEPGGGPFGRAALDGELDGGGGGAVRRRGGVARVQVVQDAWRAEERPAGAVTGQTRGETAVLPFPAGGVRMASRGEREWKERDRDSGIFVNKTKFCISCCNLNFSPCSCPQTKNF